MSEKCFFVVENCFYSFVRLEVSVGDIFVTDKGIHYIPYNNVMVTGGTGTGIAYLIGGVTGIIAATAGDKERIKGALKIADENRTEEWGMKLDERLKKHPRAFYVPKESIINFEGSKDNLIIVAHDRRWEFGTNVFIKYKQDLHDYLSGKEVSRSDTYGFNIKFHAPKIFLDSLLADKMYPLNSSNELMLEIAEDQKYMLQLYSIFERMITREQISISKAMRHFPEAFTSKFKDLILRAFGKNKVKLQVSSIFILLGLIAVFYISFFRESGWGPGPITLPYALSTIGLIVGMPSIFSGTAAFLKFRKYRLILNTLETGKRLTSKVVPNG